MPSLKGTKRRIVSVKNTQKITRAMKLVSSAKYARANQAIMKSSAYSRGFQKLLDHFLLTCTLDEAEKYFSIHSEERDCLFIIVTTDRGLCGGLNTNIIKRCHKFLSEKKARNISVEMALWGKKAGVFAKNRTEAVFERKEKVIDKPSYDFCVSTAKSLLELVGKNKFQKITVAYPAFKNAMTQEATIQDIYPIPFTDRRNALMKDHLGPFQSASSSVVEPIKAAMADKILVSYLASVLYKVLLESSASEHAARMTAMDSATNNADKVIKKLTLDYNRARQAAITKELIEITSGAQAL